MCNSILNARLPTRSGIPGSDFLQMHVDVVPLPHSTYLNPNASFLSAYSSYPFPNFSSTAEVRMASRLDVESGHQKT